MFRTITWFVLVIIGAGGTVAALLFLDRSTAWAIGISAVGSWVGFGVITSHYFGVRRHVMRHLGPKWDKGEVVSHNVRTGERVNIQTALNELRQTGAGVFGMPSITYTPDEEGNPGDTSGGIFAAVAGNPEPVPITWERMPRSHGETLDCAANALYLLRWQGQPFCALIQGTAATVRKQAKLQILALDKATAQGALDEILRLSRERSVYKGSVISLERFDRKDEDFSVRFHDLPLVERDAIVLPERVLEVVERNVLGFLAYADELRNSGLSTRHGVLLHGPPGTGKTLVTRYLALAAKGYTVFLLAGRQYSFLRPTCQLARLLAPSLVILEDVDLIAIERQRNRHAQLLQHLMDEMDGLGPSVDALFLLTTNRPEVVEPALAARPGRVDQAIFFPLPDIDCRRRLFARFGKGLNLNAVDIEPLLRRTEGASPAFLQELFRRAVLMAVERGEHSKPLRVLTEDFERALRELVEFGGSLTRNFLGFPATEGQGA